MPRSAQKTCRTSSLCRRVPHLRASQRSGFQITARVAVVTNDERPLGFAITTTSFGLENGLIAELEDLYVLPAARRQGLAKRLIDDSARWADDRGCHHLELVVAPNGREVTHLHTYYRMQGFLDEGWQLLSRAAPMISDFSGAVLVPSALDSEGSDRNCRKR